MKNLEKREDLKHRRILENLQKWAAREMNSRKDWCERERDSDAKGKKKKVFVVCNIEIEKESVKL